MGPSAVPAVQLRFALVDVFAETPLAGNGLAIFFLDEELPTAAMLRLTQEMRQFESIFLLRTPDPACFQARIFTMEEELGFAGHPLIGAAAWLHQRFAAEDTEARWVLRTPVKDVPVISSRAGDGCFAEMDQGKAAFLGDVPADRQAALLAALGLSADDLAANLPLQVISTGLPYLIVPLRQGLDRAGIRGKGFEALLAGVGAKFAYVLDVANREGRTWDNDGKIEDIATGSAAGPAGAYLVRHGLVQAGETIVLKQGRFVGRPSELQITVTSNDGLRVQVKGQVCSVGAGTLELPAALLG